jgi:Mn2+/Fe2+ NRAMP family transporter
LSTRNEHSWSLSFGPGLVFALSVIGPGDLVSNTVVGATFGYALIWGLLLTILFRYTWLNTSAKYVLATGESLLAGFARLGKGLVWLLLACVVLIRHFSNLYKFVLMGSTAHLLLPLPMERSATIWSLLLVFTGFGLMFWGGYRTIERYFKFLVALMGGTLVAATVLSHPNPMEILHGALIPSIPGARGLYSSALVLTSLVGMEAGSLTNVSYTYFMHQKGWRNLSFLRHQRSDLLLSVCCLFLMGALLQITAAGTLHPLGISPEGPEQLVQVFTRTLGVAGKIIFGFGLLATAFAGYVGTTTGYALIATDICRNILPCFASTAPARWSGDELRRDPVYRGWILFWCFSPLYVLLLPARPVWLVLGASTLMVLLIPVLALALMFLTNDAKRMGQYRNGWFSNMVLILLIAVAVYLTCKNLLEWGSRLSRGFQ